MAAFRKNSPMCILLNTFCFKNRTVPHLARMYSTNGSVLNSSTLNKPATTKPPSANALSANANDFPNALTLPLASSAW